MNRGTPTVVAGVPPDYFSPTGQLWGNPLYRWDVLRETGYAWWIERLRAALRTVDLVRLDHFRGFEAYLGGAGRRDDGHAAGAGSRDRAPTCSRHCKRRWARESLPIIAEDLGVITPEVDRAARAVWACPACKILQFAFSRASPGMDAPYRVSHNCVVYVGTHDNDTALGWLHHSSCAGRARSWRCATWAVTATSSTGTSSAWR